MKASYRSALDHLRAVPAERWVLLCLGVAFAIFGVVLLVGESRFPVAGR